MLERCGQAVTQAAERTAFSLPDVVRGVVVVERNAGGHGDRIKAYLAPVLTYVKDKLENVSAAVPALVAA